MNKRFSTLLATALVAGGLSSTAVAEEAAASIVKGDYYYLETEIGSHTGHLVVSKENKDAKETLYSIIASGSAEENANVLPLAKGDSALWKVDYSYSATDGKLNWTFKNKATGTQLSVAPGSNAVDGENGVKVGAPLSGSLAFNFGDALSDCLSNAQTLSSYIASKDSTLSFSLMGDEVTGSGYSGYNKKPVTLVMSKGTDAGESAATFKAVRADQRALTVEELNEKLNGRGFQLFFNYKNELTADNNALAGKIFKAEGRTNVETDTLVYLKAATIAPLYSKSAPTEANYSYAFVDTVWYNSDVKTTDGSGLTFRVDTLPTHGAAVSLGIIKSVFRFRIDPSSAADSVAVFVESTYTTESATAPRTWAVKSVTTTGLQAFPLRIYPLGGTSQDKKILSTDTEHNVLTALHEDTRISFTGETLDALFDADKVYSIQNMNERTEEAENAGKFLVADLEGDDAWGSAAYDHMPSTQFVFDGAQMINREVATVATGSLYVVDEDENLYTNMADTFKIEEMKKVDIENGNIGWGYMEEDSLTNYAFSLDYISGILEGRSVNMKDDSTIVATTEGGMLFKLFAVEGSNSLEETAADNEEVAVVENNAYNFKTKDGKYVVVANGKKLALKSVSGGAEASDFYLKETENKGEFILISIEDEATYKYNVNSTNEALEQVAMGLQNNAFAVQVEPAPEYVLDAKGHYNIENLRGDMLAADANGFGMFRKEGELKATYGKEDFALWIDTAKIHPTKPSYFILSGAKAEKESSKLEGNFLRVMADSADVEGYKADNGKIRLAFVPAKREATSDSLLVNYQNETLVKEDSVGYKGKQVGIDQFRFFIQYTENEGEYIVENTYNNGAAYLATYNDVLCLVDGNEAKKEALIIRMPETSAPTANEGVEVSAVTVIAGEGQVTIAGAAGKKVVISNILGQTVANTVIASDNATIAAPQGVVVVAVEGEEAVKAIVK